VFINDEIVLPLSVDFCVTPHARYLANFVAMFGAGSPYTEALKLRTCLCDWGGHIVTIVFVRHRYRAFSAWCVMRARRTGKYDPATRYQARDPIDGPWLQGAAIVALETIKRGKPPSGMTTP
jgi:hypothetical protein